MSKRANIFEQGKPEQPYNDREEGPVEAPQRATAAQLAARKIKTMKGPRRAQSSTPGLSQSANFGMPQQQQPPAQSSGFNFGATAPIPNSSNNAFGFGSQQQSAPSGGGFGGSTTSSFPPAQAPTPNNVFSNSSFPAFGADNTNAFNPQPPSANAFNFSAGGANPFAASTPAPAATNGAGSGGFSGSIFSMPQTQAQPASNPFNFGGAQNNNPVSTATSSSIFSPSAAPQSNLFGAMSSGAPASNLTASAPQSNVFGTVGSTSNATAPAASGGLFNFGQTSAPSRESSPAPAAAGGLFAFGQNGTPSREPSPAPATSGFKFGQQNTPSREPSPAPAASGFKFGQNNTPSRESSPAPAASGFKFGQNNTPSRESSPAPPSNPFGSTNVSTPAPQSNPFNFGSTAQSAQAAPVSDSTPKFSFGQTPKTNNAATTAPESPLFKSSTTPASNPFNFGSTVPKPESQPQSSLFNFGTPKAPESTAPKTDLFAFQKSSTPAQSSPGGLFGQSQQPTQPESVAQNGISTTVEYPSLNASLEATKTPFSFTPQKPLGSSTNNVPATTPSLAPPKANPFANLGRSSSPSKEAGPATPLIPPPKENAFASPAWAKSPTKEAAPTLPQPPANANPFATLPRASVPAPATPASIMPTLTGAVAPQEATKGFEIPKIPKAHIPASWPKASFGNMTHSSNLDQLTRGLVELGAELSTLNQRFREKINSMPTMADWSSLSSWHSKETAKIAERITAVKKQRAAAKGVTGYESALSTKRKVTEDTAQDDASTTTPTKKFRAGDTMSTPPQQQQALFSTTPKNNPPASNTSNLFGSIINSAPASAPPVQTSSIFANVEPKAVTNSTPSLGFQVPAFGNIGAAASSKKDTPSQTGLQFGSSLGTSSKNDAPSQTGFQFSSSLGTSSKNDGASKSGFQVPAFGNSNGEIKSNSSVKSQGGFQMPSFGGAAGTNFANQFAKKAKTREQLAAERKQKAKDEDYDSDDETEEQWDARYDAEEKARKAEEERKIKAASGFKLRPTEPTTGASVSKPAFSLPKPASGISTPGLFGSRAGSPAPSTSGGQSVFDTPPASNTPNIFGHLSSGPSSNNHDESSDEEDDGDQTEGHSQADQPTNSARSTPPPMRQSVQQDSGSESDEESMKRKKQGNASAKPSLLSRMTRVDDIETNDAEKDTDQSKDSPSIFAQSNGVQTPAAKAPFFFDFANAGAKTAPPKDHTFKNGTPIKFGAAPATESKAAAPLFMFQPATPSPAEFSSTPTKPAPFSFLSASNLTSGPVSVSGLSSRAATPLSDVDNSAAENDDEEGSKLGQLDLSNLTDVEMEKYDVVFHADLALAKRPSEKDGVKGWESFARGPLWILKDKETGKALLRIRIPSGKTPLNYNLLPKLQAKAAGSSKKQIFASYPNEEGKLTNILLSVKNSETAEELLDAYNNNLPS